VGEHGQGSRAGSSVSPAQPVIVMFRGWVESAVLGAHPDRVVQDQFGQRASGRQPLGDRREQVAVPVADHCGVGLGVGKDGPGGLAGIEDFDGGGSRGGRQPLGPFPAMRAGEVDDLGVAGREAFAGVPQHLLLDAAGGEVVLPGKYLQPAGPGNRRAGR
jgi:hypothetical protein